MTHPKGRYIGPRADQHRAYMPTRENSTDDASGNPAYAEQKTRPPQLRELQVNGDHAELLEALMELWWG